MLGLSLIISRWFPLDLLPDLSLMARAKDERIHELRSEYEGVQKKTFTKWANSFLKERNLTVLDLYQDLRDGRNLLALLERLSGETLVRCRILKVF